MPFRPNGVVVGWFFFPTGTLDPLRNPAYEVLENDIALGGFTLAGVFANAAGVLIEENEIAVEGVGAQGISLASASGLLRENSISGSGAFGIRLAPFFPAAPSIVADGNTLLCNRVRGFTSTVADVALAGNHNTVIGEWESILDTGTGNEWIPSPRCQDGRH